LLDVGACAWRHRQSVGLDARTHRREVGVGDREGAEQKRPAALHELLVPHLHDALQVAHGRRRFAQQARADLWQRGFNVHRETAAQRAEAGVHLGAQAARAGPCTHGGRPEMLVREFLGQVLGNGQCVPHREAVVHKHGHTASRSDCGQSGLEFRPVLESQSQLDFVERDARVLHQQPGAQRPGRVVLVADVELHAASSLTQASMLASFDAARVEQCASRRCAARISR